ncbi:MAG: DUF975 family protein [Oscillibacter sp.]
MMMAEMIDRKQHKADAKICLRSAQVSPKAMMALYMGLVLALNLVDVVAGGGAAGLVNRNPLGTFVSVLTGLLGLVLATGFTLYCMALRRGERAEFLSLFDGFSFVGKIIGLYLVEYFFIFLWSMLFAIPGMIAIYRYRFAIYNLCENPELGVMEALDMSKRQTLGYKGQLFMLDLSYFGWSLLASIPVGYEGYYLAQNMAMPIPTLVYILLVGLWSLAVSLFYFPGFQCVDLSYYDVAVRTSGISAVPCEAPPRMDDGGNSF